MRSSVALIVLAVAVSLAACGQQNASKSDAQATHLDSPTSDSNPGRNFAPTSDTARSATGTLTMTIATRLPDAGASNADAQETLTLHGTTGLNIDAQITGAVSPATQVQGQTLRALLNIPVEAPEVLVYHVSSEAKPVSGQGLCGADAPQYVVVWEPSDPGATAMKVMGVSGGAPGAASAHACAVLEYQRA